MTRSSLALSLPALLLASACVATTPAEPLRIVEVSFENTVVVPGQTIAISALATSGGDDPSYTWAVEEGGGTLSSTNTAATTWTAPETTQLVEITLTVAASIAGEDHLAVFRTDLVVGPGIDHDGDGYSINQGDCDDTNASIYPGSPDVEDGFDNDCDGELDEGSPEFDDDGDGYADLEGDCDDEDPAIFPGAPEVLNGEDDDCDGTTDEGTNAYDDDGDGFSEQENDCNDNSTSVGPEAPEVLDGVDNNCNGTTDENTAAYDDDGDGYSELQGDCNDDPAAGGPVSFPGNAEEADGLDNDCNGLVDDGDFATDDDGDGWSELAGDCNDEDPFTYPGAPEWLDQSDNDCDCPGDTNGDLVVCGVGDTGVDEDMNTVDNDEDGQSEAQGDCDDFNPTVYTGAPEIDDSPFDIDNDCDGFGFENPPYAVATTGVTQVQVGTTVLLDGSQSWDPDGDSFIYYWYFAWQPIDSNLTSSQITDAGTASASFAPDVPGTWIVGLLVNDSMFNSAPALIEIDVIP